MLRWLLSISLVLVFSCAGTPKSASDAGQSTTGSSIVSDPFTTDSLLSKPASPDRNIAHESFLRGLYLRNIGRPNFAEPFYKRALVHEPDNRFLAFELVDLLVNEGNVNQALSIARQAIHFPGELRSNEGYLMARLYRENGLIDSARIWYEVTIDKWPTHLRALYEYSVLLEITQDYKNLSRIYDLMIPELNYPKPMVDKQMLLLKLKGNESNLLDFLRNAYSARPDAEVGRELVSLLIDQRKNDEALEVGLSLVELDSTDMESWRLMVRMAVRSGDLQRALEWQRKVKNIEPDNQQEVQRLAMLEFEAGALDSATIRFETLLKKTPTDHLSHFYLSNLANLAGDTARAVESIQKAIALKPDALTYRNQLAGIYYLRHQYDDAHKVLDAALKLHPDHPLAMKFKASAFIHQALWLESTWPADSSKEAKQARTSRLNALTWLRKAYRVDSLSADILFDLAANLERLDSLKQAQTLFEDLIRMEPRNHRALNYLGYMLVDRKIDINRGALLIDSALVAAPGDPAYLDSKAWAYYRQGKFQEARQILELITGEMGESHVVYWEHLATIYDQLGLVEKAMPLWRKVLEMNPRNAEAKKRLQSKPVQKP